MADTGVVITIRRSGAAGDYVASYEAPGRIVGDRLRADFGDLGIVDVRMSQFRTAGRLSRRGCSGRVVSRAVSLAGTIRFTGEHGYVRVLRRQAHGVAQYFVPQIPNVRCRRPPRANARVRLPDPAAIAFWGDLAAQEQHGERHDRPASEPGAGESLV